MVYILYKSVYLQKQRRYLMAILRESYGYLMVRVGKPFVIGHELAVKWKRHNLLKKAQSIEKVTTY